jgi:quercetin 2,3-dioxygenase
LRSVDFRFVFGVRTDTIRYCSQHGHTMNPGLSEASRAVVKTVVGQPTSDGAGVRLTRVMGTAALDSLDPFLLLDEFRSDDPNDYIAGFPDHPHRGFETVTYMLAGRMRHGDNQGNSGSLGPGSVQWMTAGRGIVHSELPEQERGLLWGFQLWVNLPASEKMTAPRYQDIPAADIPEVAIADGVTARVVAGRSAGHDGPVHGVATEPLYLDLGLDADARATVPVPATHNAFLYVYQGAVRVGPEADPRNVRRGELAVLGPGESVDVGAGPEPARLLLVAGRPLAEPVARYGPFVMNTPEEIQQAFADYRAGRL